LGLEVQTKETGLDLTKLSPEMLSGIMLGINKESIGLRNYINTRHLTGGTTNDRLSTVSGRLKASGKIIEAGIKGNDIIGGVEYGGSVRGGKPVKYAGVHMGPVGQVTKIKSSSGKYLAIPIMAGRTPAGKEKTEAKRLKDRRLLDFIPRRGKPPLLVQTGKNVFNPMYVLKKSVKIKSRVHPELILIQRQDKMAAGVGKELDRVIKKSAAILKTRTK